MPRERGDSYDEIVAESVRGERQTGADSIPTIERVYETNSAGNYCCPFPGCEFVRNDAVAMWRHVHGPAHHGPSYRRVDSAGNSVVILPRERKQ